MVSPAPRCDVNAVNKSGCPVLHHARTDAYNVDCARLLVEEFGADVDCRDAKGNSLLHLAALDGNEYVSPLPSRVCGVSVDVHVRSELDVGAWSAVVGRGVRGVGHRALGGAWKRSCEAVGTCTHGATLR